MHLNRNTVKNNAIGGTEKHAYDFFKVVSRSECWNTRHVDSIDERWSKKEVLRGEGLGCGLYKYRKQTINDVFNAVNNAATKSHRSTDVMADVRSKMCANLSLSHGRHNSAERMKSIRLATAQTVELTSSLFSRIYSTKNISLWLDVRMIMNISRQCKRHRRQVVDRLCMTSSSRCKSWIVGRRSIQAAS